MRKMILASLIAALVLVGCSGSTKPHAEIATAASSTANPSADSRAVIWRQVVTPYIPAVASMSDVAVLSFATSMCDLARSSLDSTSFELGVMQASAMSNKNYTPEQNGALEGASLQSYCPEQEARLSR